MHDLADVYRAYLRCLNDRRFDQLDDYVEDALTYNGEAISRSQYAAMIADDCGAIPDLRFDVAALVVDERTVACRLAFRCTLEHAWRGYQPNGKTIEFAEHVFYDFSPGRIRRVWSLIDEAAIAAQMAA